MRPEEIVEQKINRFHWLITMVRSTRNFEQKFISPQFTNVFFCSAFSSARKFIRETELIENGFGRVFGGFRCVRSRSSAR